jgi:transcriptional regulator GlxA family with amidase domain
MNRITKKIDRRIELIIRRMHQCGSQGCPDLSEMARSLDMSLSHLRHLFKRELGVSPSRYLKVMRLEKLRRLLMGSKIQIKQAIAASGLSDFSHTVRDYKALYGQTPLETNCRANTKVKLPVFDL